MVRNSAGVAWLLTVVVVGATVTVLVPAAAAQTASIEATPAIAGATATHTVHTTVTESSDGESLTAVRFDYQGSHADLSGVGPSNIEVAGVDRDNDGTVDVALRDDITSVTATQQGRVLVVSFSGSYTLSAGSTLMFDYSGVTNPPQANTYGIAITINPDSTRVTKKQVDLQIDQPGVAVTDVTVNDTSVAPGEAVSVTASLHNWADSEESIDVSVASDGVVVATKTVAVSPGASTSTSFAVSFDTTGDHTIAVNDRSPITVSVTDSPTSLAVASYAVERTSVATGEPVTVTATITNTGTSAGSLTVTLCVDGVAVQNTTVMVPAGGEKGVSFTTSFASASEHTVTVNDRPATTLTVTQSHEPGVGQYDANNNGQIDTFELVTAIVDWRTAGTPDPGPQLLLDLVDAWKQASTA